MIYLIFTFLARIRKFYLLLIGLNLDIVWLLSFEDEDEDEVIEGSDELPPVILEGGLRIPGSVYNQLFDYQKVGV